MTTFLNSCNSFRLWYYFTSSTSIISVSVKKKILKNKIATITTGDYKTANQIWMATVSNSLRTISECANL